MRASQARDGSSILLTRFEMVSIMDEFYLDEQAHTRRRRVKIAAAVTALVVLASAGFWIWFKNQPAIRRPPFTAEKSVPALVSKADFGDEAVLEERARVLDEIAKLKRDSADLRENFPSGAASALDLLDALDLALKKYERVLNAAASADEARPILHSYNHAQLPERLQSIRYKTAQLSGTSTVSPEKARRLDRIIEKGSINELQTPAAPIPPATYGSTGEGETLRVGVCIVDWNDSDPLITQEEFSVVMDDVSSYYGENSYGKVRIEASYTQAEITGAHPPTRPEEFDAAVAACDLEIDFHNLDAFIIYPSATAQSWGNPGYEITAAEGEFAIGAVWLRTNQVSTSIIGHELGHAVFGLPHANGLECGAESASLAGCYMASYMNPFDIMGAFNKASHFNGWFKYTLGWITKADVNRSGTYNIAALESASSAPALLRIPYGEERGLCLEYRRPVGYDDFELPGGLRMPQNGCILLNTCVPRSATMLVDTTPGSNSSSRSHLPDFADTCISEGQQFSDSFLGLTVSFTAQADGSAQVDIDLEEDRALPSAVRSKSASSVPETEETPSEPVKEGTPPPVKSAPLSQEPVGGAPLTENNSAAQGTSAAEEEAGAEIAAAPYSADDVYEDILFFQSSVNLEERTLFLQNYQAIGNAILQACPVYFPEFPLRECARIFIANVKKESTFNQFEAHETDSEFPTLGLLQIRRSSTVDSFNEYGNSAPLQAQGIYFANPTDAQMMNIPYNIHLGMWYISLHGRSNARYTSDYCRHREIIEADPGNLAVGLSSHRIGPTAYQQGRNLDTAQSYVNKIRTDYLNLFQAEGQTPEADYFNQTLPYLASLCR